MEHRRGIYVYENGDGKRRVTFIIEGSFEIDEEGIVPDSAEIILPVGKQYGDISISPMVTLGGIIAQIDSRVDNDLVPENAYRDAEEPRAS